MSVNDDYDDDYCHFWATIPMLSHRSYSLRCWYAYYYYYYYDYHYYYLTTTIILVVMMIIAHTVFVIVYIRAAAAAAAVVRLVMLYMCWMAFNVPPSFWKLRADLAKKGAGHSESMTGPKLAIHFRDDLCISIHSALGLQGCFVRK